MEIIRRACKRLRIPIYHCNTCDRDYVAGGPCGCK